MKITRSTLKSFIRKNQRKLFAKVRSQFDGMTDCVEYNTQAQFKPTTIDSADYRLENTLGIKEIWLVGSSRDYFKDYEDTNFKGIEIYNCTGTSILAIKK